MTDSVINFRLKVDASPLKRGGHLGQRVHDAGIGSTVKREHARGNFRDRRDFRRRAIERDGRADAGVGRRESEAVAAAEAKPGDRDATVDPGLLGEIIDTRLERGDGPGTILRRLERG